MTSETRTFAWVMVGAVVSGIAATIVLQHLGAYTSVQRRTPPAVAEPAVAANPEPGLVDPATAQRRAEAALYQRYGWTGRRELEDDGWSVRTIHLAGGTCVWLVSKPGVGVTQMGAPCE